MTARAAALEGAARLLAALADVEPEHRLNALVIANRFYLDARSGDDPTYREWTP
jgi:hypothetical protein